jgi:hypothetical protein
MIRDISKLEEASISETSVDWYHTTRSHNPVDGHLHSTILSSCHQEANAWNTFLRNLSGSSASVPIDLLYRVFCGQFLVLRFVFLRPCPVRKFHVNKIDYQRFRNYQRLILKIIRALRRISGSFMHLVSKIPWCGPSLLFTLRSYTMFFMYPIHGDLWGMRSGDRSGQFCRPPRPIHRPGNW